MERIFTDYEVWLNSLQQRELEADAREYRRSEFARVQQIDRLAAQGGENLMISVVGAQVWQGRLNSVGNGWVQLASSTENVLIPLHAISWWEGGSHFASIDRESVRRKLSFNYALRALGSARLPARVVHIADRETTEGTIENVGMDFIEVALHGIEGNYRSKKIAGYRVVPISQVAAVCSQVMDR